MKMKKKKITIAVLFGVLVALILLYFLVIAPLMENQGTQTIEPATPQEGEGLYYGSLTMFPVIKDDDVISITITNSHGTFSFENKISESSGNYALRLAEYPRLTLNSKILTELRVYALNTQCVNPEPLRDCSPEMMAKYGVTKDTCTATYTVKFKENGEEKSHTVYIGDKTLAASGSYFATVEGRDVIYEVDSGIEGGILLAQTDFVDTLIASQYTSTEVVYEVNKILIGNSGTSTPFVGIGANRIENADTVMVKYTVQYPTNAKNVSASTDYISKALNALLVNFTGSRVVQIDPDEQTRAKYGLDASSTKKIVSVGTFDDKEFVFTLSQKMKNENGVDCYYLYAGPATDKDVALIIEVTALGYEFLEEENAIKWVATNSFEAGFTKYIYENAEVGESGVADITISANTNAIKDFKDKFILEHSPHPTDASKGDILTVTSESGRYTFVDLTNVEDSSYKNEFRNFYAIMVNYPMPNRFNTMTAAEREAKKTQENLILSIRVTLNDGTKMGYDYYKLDAANVMCEFFDDKNPEPTVVFDTTIQHVDIFATALSQLVSGEHVEKH